MEMAPDFPPLHPFLCLCQLRGFLSVVRAMRGWCRRSEGDVLYSDLVQMHPIMIMFCYLYVPPAPVPLLWKSECCKQLQRLLPFSPVFTTVALPSYHTDTGSSSSLRSAPLPAGVFRESLKYTDPARTHTALSYRRKHTHTHVRTPYTQIHACAQTQTCKTVCENVKLLHGPIHTHTWGKLPQLFAESQQISVSRWTGFWLWHPNMFSCSASVGT